MINIRFPLGFAILTFTNQAFGSEAGMPQLNPEFWVAQIFWLLLTFSILYLIIWKIFLPKITYSIENRKSRIVNDLNDAQKLKETAEEKLKEYNKIIENAKGEAKKVMEESNKILDLDIEKKKNKFNSEIEKEMEAVEKEIKDLKKSSILNINKIATEVTGEVIKKIIDSDVNKSSVSAVVKDVAKKEMENNL